MTPYENMMYSTWLPKVRSSINNDWDPKHPEAVILLLESWSPLLPQFIVDNIEEQLILPKLQRAVEAWDPRTDRTPIHQWLHPWLPILAEQLQPLYVIIRHKLATVLELWQAADGSALGILLPWKEVFT